MKVGDYVKVIDARDIHPKEVGDIVKVTDRNVSGSHIKFQGDNLTWWLAKRFDPLPILTEAPPKGSKVVKVEKSRGNGLVSDKYSGKVFTTTGGEGDVLHFLATETGGFNNSNITKGKWALVSLPETEKIAQTEYEEGEYLKVIKDLDNLSVGDLVQYIGDEGDGYVRIECKGLGVGVVLQDCVEKLPILTEPVPIGSEVVKIQKDGRAFDKYLGRVFEVFSGDLPHHRILIDNGMRYNFHASDLSSWALVEAAKVETEFQVGDRVTPKKEITATETREFQGECLDIDQLLAKCHTLAAKKSFVSRIFKKGYWV